ncbi:MAG: alpha/beta hydrolase [Caulobacterales bacterium]|nr:alpha/beta hydrolase [Caulobacterales bacterium]
MRQATAQVAEGVRLHYRLMGEGLRTVVLLHGFPQTGHEWRAVMPALAAAGFQVVAPDYRGAGHSSRPAGGYDKWTLAGDIQALVRGPLAVRGPFVLVGHDVGAMVALAAAFRFRAEVSHLVLIDAPLQGTQAMEAMRGDPRGWHVAFHGARDIAELLVQGRERAYLRYMLDVRLFDPSAIAPADFEHYVAAYEAAGAMRAAFELYRAFERDAADVKRALAADGKLPMPALSIGGEAGGLGAAMRPMLAELAGDATHLTAPRSAHWVPEENPQFVAEAILRLAG